MWSAGMADSDDLRLASSPAVRVAIVEDHQLLSASLAAALTGEGCKVFVADLRSTRAIVDQLVEAKPDLVLLDLDLGERGRGEDLLRPLTANGLAVLVVSANGDEAVIGRCLHDGAIGWVPKSASFDQLLSVVVDAARGRSILGSEERDRFLRIWRTRRTASEFALAPFGRLSPRERAVLALLIDGWSVDRIATTEFLSESTVRTHVRAILTKLGVNSQLAAVAMAKRAGWPEAARPVGGA